MNTSQEKKESILPSPELLEKYEKISKGLSKELVSLLKKEQEHRQKMQKAYLRSFKLGQIFGALFLIYIITMIFELANRGKTEIACLMTIVFGVLIILILYQYRKDKMNSIMIKNSGKNGFFKRNIGRFKKNKKEVNR